MARVIHPQFVAFSSMFLLMAVTILALSLWAKSPAKADGATPVQADADADPLEHNQPIYV